MTPQELRKAALQELQVLPAGQDASPEDDAVVSARYDALYDMLLSEGLVAWASGDDIPEYAQNPVTQMLAYFCAPAFGIAGQRLVDLKINGALNLPIQMGGPSLAERQLRRQLAKKPVPYPVSSEYY
jgi:hypothetical protein